MRRWNVICLQEHVCVVRVCACAECCVFKDTGCTERRGHASRARSLKKRNEGTEKLESIAQVECILSVRT